MGEVGFALRTELKCGRLRRLLRTELKCGRSLRKLGFALRRVEVWKKSSPIVFPNPRVTIMRDHAGIRTASIFFILLLAVWY